MSDFPSSSRRLALVPVTLDEAQEYVDLYHTVQSEEVGHGWLHVVFRRIEAA